MSMSKTEIKVLCGYITFLVVILLFVSFTGCDSGWSIMDWEVK
jgi:predicted RND superfamily exporter protein